MPEEKQDPILPSGSINMSEIDYSRTPQRTMYYANHVQAAVSLFDIRVILASVEGIDPTINKLVPSSMLTLLLAPEFAHIVHTVLGKALENYRSIYGPLRGSQEPVPTQEHDQQI